MSDLFDAGDLVKLRASRAGEVCAVVSRPIGPGSPGHVLVQTRDGIEGVDASYEELERADETDDGFAQLAYGLIKLGSHVIEEKLIV